DPGRLACAHHDHLGYWRATNGPAQCDHTAVGCGGDTRLGVAYLLRQKWHGYAYGDGGGGCCPCRIDPPNKRARRCARRGEQEGRKAGEKGFSARTHGSGLHTLQRRSTFSTRRYMEGGGRSDRRRALSIRCQTRHGSGGGAERIATY